STAKKHSGGMISFERSTQSASMPKMGSQPCSRNALSQAPYAQPTSMTLLGFSQSMTRGTTMADDGTAASVSSMNESSFSMSPAKLTMQTGQHTGPYKCSCGGTG